MNGLMLIATANSRSACNALHAAQYPCAGNANHARCQALTAAQTTVAKLWRHPQQPCFSPQSTPAIPCAATVKPLGSVENT